MRNFETANGLSGRAIGAMFFTGFGALWLLLSLYAREELGTVAVCAVLMGALLLALASLRILREAKRWPRVPEDPAMGRAFMWINAIQWIAIGAVSFGFAKGHIDAYVMNAIAGIVGLHFFPLARLFRYSMHYVTGSVMVIWAAMSIFIVPIEQLQGVAALGTGVILWASAVVTLTLAFQAMRQPIRSAAF